MNLRKHQQQLSDILDAGTPRRIFASCVPSAGKSLLPVIAAAKMIPTRADALCWVCPRQSLQFQAEEAFQAPDAREFLKHSHSIRASTNDENPCRGLAGFVTTYQALASRKAGPFLEMHKRRYILILDEFHHLATDTAFTNAVAPLVDCAVLTIFMSGTMERHKSRVAFLNYEQHNEHEEIETPKVDESESCKLITYSRTDALQDKAIIRAKFTCLDAKATFKRHGVDKSVDTIKTGAKKTVNTALFVALQTEYAIQLLNDCVTDWLTYKDHYPRAKLLVVAATQKLARVYDQHLKSQGFTPCLAITDEGAACLKAVKRFRKSTLPATDILVTVGVGYEGLDVRSLSHIALLTRIRSKSWLDQCINRATRYDPAGPEWEKQEAHIYAPDDEALRSVVSLIEREQAAFLKNKKPSAPSAGRPGEQGTLFADITPVGSSAHGKRSQKLFTPSAPVETIHTPSEQEQAIRDEIEMRVRGYAIRKSVKPQEINGRIKAKFRKSRTEMTLTELEKVKSWVDSNLR